MAKTEKIKYLIIGNSAGGIGAAEAIREADKNGTITIVSDEPYHVYSRPQISGHLAEGRLLEEILYRKADFYRKNNIETILGSRVTRLDPANNQVEFEDSKIIGYEKLLLATGGTPIVPPMEGLEREKTFTFTTLDDAKAIDEFLNRHPDKTVRAVVIGGGLIGVSVTEALVKRGAKVSIIEMKDRILNTILDEEGSALGLAALKEAEVEVITEHTVTRVSTDAKGQTTGVTLDDGGTIDCDLVIVAIGVQPRTELAAGTDITLNRGIVVNRYMASSIPNIYACGDVAEAYDFVHEGNRLSPIWPNAYIGGRTAGLNMAGVSTEYEGGTAMNSMKYFGTAITSAGLVVPPDDSYEIFESRLDHAYKKVVVKDGLVVGMVFSGDIEKSGIIYNLMKDRVNVEDFKLTLVAEDFGLISLPEEIWRSKLEMPGSESNFPAVNGEEPEEIVILD
ncbi:MAG: FAD-dependent oxidoreductase [Dehalococcoidales bacterium]